MDIVTVWALSVAGTIVGITILWTAKSLYQAFMRYRRRESNRS
jgi:hypothetical protein